MLCWQLPEFLKNKMAYTAKTHAPPQRFLEVSERSWRCEEEGEEGEGGEEEEEIVSLLTHTTARGMGKHLFSL